MAFDVGRAMQGLEHHEPASLSDVQRSLRDLSRPYSVKDVLRRYREMLREVSGVAKMQKSLQVSAASAAGHVRAAEVVRRGVYAPLADLDSLARLQTGALRQQVRALGDLGRSSVWSHALGLQELTSTYDDAWRIQAVQSLRTPALQYILKSSTTYGPIVISPDDEDPPFDYHPDLQGWLLPETATHPGGAIDVEELLGQVFDFAADVAQLYDSRVSVSIVGKSGLRYLVRVSETVVGGLILFWLLHR